MPCVYHFPNHFTDGVGVGVGKWRRLRVEAAITFLGGAEFEDALLTLRGESCFFQPRSYLLILILSSTLWLSKAINWEKSWITIIYLKGISRFEFSTYFSLGSTLGHFICESLPPAAKKCLIRVLDESNYCKSGRAYQCVIVPLFHVVCTSTTIMKLVSVWE